ncbi:hypothetical protein DPMN_032588 [Dreissena polymorpha]|uniref:Uncharacterized protein n=1 Tax=Dreissena polymorpha TaxID=45954 RepID=A0A9D4M369_DREPO|nr:hypothetical protein DPMN_032588 [Dreissena polymorpha]
MVKVKQFLLQTLNHQAMEMKLKKAIQKVHSENGLWKARYRSLILTGCWQFFESMGMTVALCCKIQERFRLEKMIQTDAGKIHSELNLTFNIDGVPVFKFSNA